MTAATGIALGAATGTAAADWKAYFDDDQYGGSVASGAACEREAAGWRSSDLGASCIRVEVRDRWDLVTWSIGG
ncbi:hypothetical protein AB0H00_12835 [Nocardia sp. NPDC023852]|uniref:hypothetical protein n=1 Tax=Nocardia sp. NPDC023852 TaxID=3154697 RepID=UPI00340C49CF